MVPVVFFSEVSVSDSSDKINEVVYTLLSEFVRFKDFELGKCVPLKVTFGESGNKTFIPAGWMLGAIDFLAEKKIESAFMETNVLYRGERTNRKDHVSLAMRHGFTRLPVVIADGELGEAYEYVKIKGKHFSKCMIAKGVVDESQLLVVSHFKGHVLAGFGGAIKQLGMGCASRGGKLAQHMGSAPIVNSLTCKKCNMCVEKCPVHAISMSSFSARIDSKKCIGCAACIAVCPFNVIKINWVASLVNNFSERLVEYAFASQLNKKNIYLTYAVNMTKDCDCIGKEMKPLIDDLGVFVSDDPVACDRAILDLLKLREGKNVFSEKNTFLHADKIGFGSQEYVLKKL
ncbi:DUF362 domain-containing protein [Candidatus Woesearchaeota archaeon]|nr:DUF362 domain-containing protein [Candidatus Woesearchaeota archaeon]